MQNLIDHWMIPLMGMAAGMSIGLAFGALQAAGYRQNLELQRTGNMKKWRWLPGSGGRVALLLLTLAFIQGICPLLFKDGTTQWWVTGGVGAGYGWSLYRQMRQRLAQIK